MYVWPIRAPVHNPLYIYAHSYQSRCRSQKHVQLFHRWSSLKREGLVSSIVASAIPVNAAVFYSPVLQIDYDGIFRLREARNSLLLTFGKSYVQIAHAV